MIAYEVLVQTIADWKAGARPTAPTPAVAPVAAAPEPVEDLSSGVVDFDEEPTEAYEGYAEQGYEAQDYAAEPSDASEPELDTYVDDEDPQG